jgi:hypothetical protein
MATRARANRLREANKTAQPSPPIPSSASNITVLTRQPVAKAPRPHSKTPDAVVPAATINSLAAFETILSTLITAEVAKSLTSTMKLVIQLGSGGKNHKVIEARRQKIRDLLKGVGDGEVLRLYGEYAKVQIASEKRLTYRLPLVGDEDDRTTVEAEGRRDVSEVPTAADEMVKDTAEEDGVATEEGVHGQGLVVPTEDDDAEMEDAPIMESIETQLTGRDTALSPSPYTPRPMLEGIPCGKHATAERACTTITVQTPEDFPITRIQEVQAQYYPSTHILNMEIHRAANNQVSQLTANIADGSVDHLVINNPRIITALGVHLPPYDKILPQHETRIDETFRIRILPGQRRSDPTAHITGELIPARHAYLYWLDSRGSADPKGPPMATESRMLAKKTGRRAFDIMNEIERYWHMEQGSGGRRYRENRKMYLGEDPGYPGDGEGRCRGMWV